MLHNQEIETDRLVICDTGMTQWMPHGTNLLTKEYGHANLIGIEITSKYFPLLS